MRMTLAFVCLCTSALADTKVTYPIPVPGECAQLAEREHVPTILANKMDALKAKLKLERLNGKDPMVAECRDAIARLKTAM
jgi:hypothetical protein